MTATVKAFPAARQAARVAQATAHMDKMTRRRDRVFNARFLMPLASELAAAGLTREEVEREVADFHRAVLDEVFQRVAERCGQSEGDAA